MGAGFRHPPLPRDVAEKAASRAGSRAGSRAASEAGDDLASTGWSSVDQRSMGSSGEGVEEYMDDPFEASIEGLYEKRWVSSRQRDGERWGACSHPLEASSIVVPSFESECDVHFGASPPRLLDGELAPLPASARAAAVAPLHA